MQFNYDNDETDTDFETNVINRLSRIENQITSFSAQNDLLQELIRKELRQSVQSTNTTNGTTEPKQLSFHVTTVIDSVNGPMYIRINGRTYDIRDRLKQIGNATWKPELKVWEMIYTEDVYKNLIEFLSTISNDIQEDSFSL